MVPTNSIPNELQRTHIGKLRVGEINKRIRDKGTNYKSLCQWSLASVFLSRKVWHGTTTYTYKYISSVARLQDSSIPLYRKHLWLAITFQALSNKYLEWRSIQYNQSPQSLNVNSLVTLYTNSCDIFKARGEYTLRQSITQMRYGNIYTQNNQSCQALT